MEMGSNREQLMRRLKASGVELAKESTDPANPGEGTSEGEETGTDGEGEGDGEEEGEGEGEAEGSDETAQELTRAVTEELTRADIPDEEPRANTTKPRNQTTQAFLNVRVEALFH
jgi:uncharacterized sporulation protein YeaH/YhbH (DUF444 family)